MKRKHATQHHSRELQSAVRRVAMREIPDSRLPLTDRCLFCSRCLDRGRRNRFPLFVLMDSSNMLPLRKASLTKRGLRLLWSNSKGFPHLTTTAQCLRRCQNTEQAWPPTFLPKPFFFTMHTCQQTVTAKCFQLRLDLLLPLKKKKTH